MHVQSTDAKSSGSLDSDLTFDADPDQGLTLDTDPDQGLTFEMGPDPDQGKRIRIQTK